jgi:hypothetical protein
MLLTVAVVSSTFVASPAYADVPFQDRGVIIDDPPQHPNICGWLATFTGEGKFHLIVEDTGVGPMHVTFHETFNYTLVLEDDPSVPIDLQGMSWRGRNVATVVFNADSAGDRVIFVSRQNFAEGPFHGLSEQITFVQDPNGVVRVDRQVLFDGVDCSALLASLG